MATLLAVLGLVAQPASAASLSPDELQILSKSLAFLQPPLHGDGTVAIVYSAADPQSHQDAQAILASLGHGLLISGVVRSLKLVEAGSLATADPDLIIVAAGANSEAVMRATRARHSLCVTADIQSVKAGMCVMAIRSAQRVEILLNYQAARDAGLTFANAFRMMVQEL